jgi:uncharacterized protein
MATMKDIRRVAREIGRRFGPERVVLFGSHARGEASRDSDVDLLVVMEGKGEPVERAVQIRMQVRPPFPVDILVRSPERVRERIAMGDNFMREVVEKGVVLYEAHRS